MKGHTQLVYPRAWTRGKPVLKGDYIAINQVEEYAPYECGDLVFDFSGLQERKDVVAFVAQYGLLKHTEGYEKVSDFLAEAASVRILFQIVIAIRKEEIKYLRDLWRIRDFTTLFEAPPKADDELMTQASILVAWTINEKLEGVPHGLMSEAAIEVDGVSGSPGNFLWVVYPENLIQYIYHHLAQTINLKAPIASCSECGRIFRVEHGRQEYCSPRCANRARIKRYRANHPRF